MLGQIHAGIEDLLIVGISQIRHRARVVQPNDIDSTLLATSRISLRCKMKKCLSIITESLSLYSNSTILKRTCHKATSTYSLRMSHKPVGNGLLKMTLRPVRTKRSPAGGTVVAGQRPLINGSPLKDVSLRTYIDWVHHNFACDGTQELIRNYWHRSRHLRLLITYFLRKPNTNIQ